MQSLGRSKDATNNSEKSKWTQLTRCAVAKSSFSVLSVDMRSRALGLESCSLMLYRVLAAATKRHATAKRQRAGEPTASMCCLGSGKHGELSSSSQRVPICLRLTLTGGVDEAPQVPVPKDGCLLNYG